MITPERVAHTLGVEKCAVDLAGVYGEDKQKALRAALLHDCAKLCKYGLKEFCAKYGIMDVYEDFRTMDVSLVHAPLGAICAQRMFGETDPGVLNAIKWHTTGRIGMSLLDKITYISDVIEPMRGDAPELTRVRALVRTDLDQAMLLGMNMAIKSVLEKNKPLDQNTIEARNYLLDAVMYRNNNLGGSQNENHQKNLINSYHACACADANAGADGVSG
jgi:nicotinate-nucleotide adenylyltransferase